MSTSTCLVLSYCTGLCAIPMVDLLSQYNLIGLSHLILKSFKIIFIYSNSQIPKAIYLNSIFAFYLDTPFYFLLSTSQGFLQVKYNNLKLTFYLLKHQHNSHLYNIQVLDSHASFIEFICQE